MQSSVQRDALLDDVRRQTIDDGRELKVAKKVRKHRPMQLDLARLRPDVALRQIWHETFRIDSSTETECRRSSAEIHIFVAPKNVSRAPVSKCQMARKTALSSRTSTRAPRLHWERESPCNPQRIPITDFCTSRQCQKHVNGFEYLRWDGWNFESRAFQGS